MEREGDTRGIQAYSAISRPSGPIRTSTSLRIAFAIFAITIPSPFLPLVHHSLCSDLPQVQRTTTPL